MIRNVLGSLVALLGAAAAVFSPFRIWYDGRHGSAYRIQDLFNGITDNRPDAGGSILIPFAFAALVVLIGVLLRSRLLVLLAGLITIGFTVLWMVRVGMAEHTLAISSDGSGLGVGVASALAGGFLMLAGAGLMSGRRRARAERAERTDSAPGAPEAPGAPGYEPYPPYEGEAGPDTIRFSSSDLPADLTAPDEPGATRAQPGTWQPRK
ncbi:hypothetical protein OHS16_17895 [Streptomyces sp. NBC_00344]